MKKKLAVVYMAHDGLTSLYTGVGSVTKDFLHSWPTVKEALGANLKEYEIDLYPTTISYKEGCFGYSNEKREELNKFIKKNENIYLMELINSSNQLQSYGTMDLWKSASISGATFIHTLADRYNLVIAITVDTPFAHVANNYFEHYDSKNVQIVWLPQSTVRIHKYGKSSESRSKGLDYEKERFEWEKAPITLSKTKKQVKIGYTSIFMKNHLVNEYDAKEEILIEMTNSLFLERLNNNKKDQEFIKQILISKNIPLDRPLIFSFGRAEPYKGLDLVIKNSKSIREKYNFFTLILTSPYSGNDPYLLDLKRSEEENPNDIKVLSGLDFLTPHYILQWKNTAILALLSRAEPFGLIPIEARSYCNENLTVIVSNSGGLVDQIDNGIDGFITSLESDDISTIFEKVAELSSKEKKEITKNGFERVNKEFDMVKININYLTYLFNLLNTENV